MLLINANQIQWFINARDHNSITLKITLFPKVGIMWFKMLFVWPVYTNIGVCWALSAADIASRLPAGLSSRLCVKILPNRYKNHTNCVNILDSLDLHLSGCVNSTMFQRTSSFSAQLTVDLRCQLLIFHSKGLRLIYLQYYYAYVEEEKTFTHLERENRVQCDMMRWRLMTIL